MESQPADMRRMGSFSYLNLKTPPVMQLGYITRGTMLALLLICSSGMRTLYRKPIRLFVPLTTPRSEGTANLSIYAQSPTLPKNAHHSKRFAQTVGFYPPHSPWLLPLPSVMRQGYRSMFSGGCQSEYGSADRSAARQTEGRQYVAVTGGCNN